MPGVSKLISTKLFQINSVIVKDKTRAIIISINNNRSNALERSETSHWIQTVFTLRQSNNNRFVYKKQPIRKTWNIYFYIFTIRNRKQSACCKIFGSSATEVKHLHVLRSCLSEMCSIQNRCKVGLTT